MPWRTSRLRPAPGTTSAPRRCRHCPPFASAPPAAKSSERKRERLNPRIEEFDLEGPVLDFTRLPDQLIEAVLGHGAVALSVGVHSVFVARSSAIEPNSEPHRLAAGCRAKDQVEIPGVEAEDHGARCGDQRRLLAAHVPLSAQGPLIYREPCRGGVGLRLVLQYRVGRDIVLLPGIAE